MRHNLTDEQIDGLMSRIIELQYKLDVAEHKMKGARIALTQIVLVKGSPPYNVARKIAEKALE